MQQAPLVGVIMGSSSDWDTMQHATQLLDEFGVSYEARVVSAHRMPDDMFAYAESAVQRGLQAIIAGAGGAAHLPGTVVLAAIMAMAERMQVMATSRDTAIGQHCTGRGLPRW